MLATLVFVAAALAVLGYLIPVILQSFVFQVRPVGQIRNSGQLPASQIIRSSKHINTTSCIFASAFVGNECSGP